MAASLCPHRGIRMIKNSKLKKFVYEICKFNAPKKLSQILRDCHRASFFHILEHCVCPNPLTPYSRVFSHNIIHKISEEPKIYSRVKKTIWYQHSLILIYSKQIEYSCLVILGGFPLQISNKSFQLFSQVSVLKNDYLYSLCRMNKIISYFE